MSVITGAGAVSPLGRTSLEFYRRLSAGESAVRPYTPEERGDLQATHVARYDSFSPQPEIPAMKARRFDRGSQFAIIACAQADRKSTRLNSSHLVISYAVFCLKK